MAERTWSVLPFANIDESASSLPFACPDEDRGTVGECVAECDRVMPAIGFIDGLLRGPHGLIGQSAQPQGAGERDNRQARWYKSKKVGIEGADLHGLRQAALEMALRCRLITQEMIRNTKHRLHHDETGGRLSGFRDLATSLCDRQ